MPAAGSPFSASLRRRLALVPRGEPLEGRCRGLLSSGVPTPLTLMPEPTWGLSPVRNMRPILPCPVGRHLLTFSILRHLGLALPFLLLRVAPSRCNAAPLAGTSPSISSGMTLALSWVAGHCQGRWSSPSSWAWPSGQHWGGLIFPVVPHGIGAGPASQPPFSPDRGAPSSRGTP